MLSVVNETTHKLSFVDKASDDGKAIIKKMYGVYANEIINDRTLAVSTPSSAEFTVPQFAYKDNNYLLREHPALRYELWKKDAPDIVLLGSSIFFCDFNRASFFERYPNKKLLDFTTGNNTPFIAHFFIKKADSMHLPFKPGTIVLYGLNRVELLQDYKDKNSHDFVKEALNNEPIALNPDDKIANFLKLSELRYDVTNGLRHIYDDMFRASNLYRKEVDSQHIQTEQAFVKYIRSAAPKFDGTKAFDDERIEEIKQLATLLEKHGCQLVLLKLPQSLYNDIAMNTEGYSYFDEQVSQLKRNNISYIDVSDHEQYDIEQRDYLWSGNVFDPEHLNVKGAQRFTKALMRHVLDSMINQQNTKH